MNKINKIDLSFGIIADREGGIQEFQFFVISKKNPRFKAKTFDLSQLNSDQMASLLAKYAMTHRLVKLIEKGELTREACISPHAPFVDELLKSTDLTIDGKEVVQINVMSESEYQAFTEQATKVSAKEIKVEEEKETQTIESKGFFFSHLFMKKVLSPATYQIVSQTIQLFQKTVQNILDNMLTKRRDAEIIKKDEEKRAELRDSIKRDAIKADRLKSTIKAESIKAEEIKAT